MTAVRGDLPPEAARVLRAQHREACEHAPLDCDDFELPWRCAGCNGNGTRWVTIGDLVDRGITVTVGTRGYDRERRYALVERGSDGRSGNLPTEVQS